MPLVASLVPPVASKNYHRDHILDSKFCPFLCPVMLPVALPESPDSQGQPYLWFSRSGNQSPEACTQMCASHLKMDTHALCCICDSWPVWTALWNIYSNWKTAKSNLHGRTNVRHILGLKAQKEKHFCIASLPWANSSALPACFHLTFFSSYPKKNGKNKWNHLFLYFWRDQLNKSPLAVWKSKRLYQTCVIKTICFLGDKLFIIFFPSGRHLN